MPSRIVNACTIIVLAACAIPVAAATGSISGTVTTRDGTAAGGAPVMLVQLSRRTDADASGAYRFTDVPPGRYLVEVVSPRYGSAVGQVDVGDGPATLDLIIDLTVHHEDVVVTAGVSPLSVAESAQSISVLDERELTAKAAPTIGETLGQEPGVSDTQYAPGASRPVIRGQGGDRIRVLENGVGVGDASNVSPDHAVTVDTYSAERIEVVRGAATLLYGSNAVGGVVNVLDRSIPDHRSGEALNGEVHLRYGSASALGSGAANLGGDVGGFGWNVGYTRTEADDQRVGSGSGFAGDTIPNSDLESQNGSVGASWLGTKAFAGASFDEFTTDYGSAVESDVRIDVTQRRWNVRGGINEPFGAFRVLKATLGGTDYEHVELEGAEIGTRFLNTSLESRVELAHEPAGLFSGSFGAQLWHRDFEAIGDEAFVRPSTTAAAALFAFEEVGTGALRGQFGLRYEHQQLESDDPVLDDRTFDAPSASAAVVWKDERWFTSGTVSYSNRVPTSEELYANGPHLATASFEVGDDTLDLERSLGFDLALRYGGERIDAEISLFYSDYSDYIYERDTGLTFTTDDGDVLPIIQFSGSAARFYGGEFHVDFGLLHAEPHHLDLEVRGDYVHAELTDRNEPVPLQPPLRGALGLRYQGRALWASVEGFGADDQTRFGARDQETPGYAWLNAAVGYRLVAGRTVHDFVLRGTNLTDKLSYNSVARFRFAVPLPGRDVTLAYHLSF